MKHFQPIIGLEVHVELSTKSKMFCGCPAEHFGVEPNTHTCPVCLGLPGALPVPNKKAVEWTILLGLALGCKINEHSKFDRKNYFYPDLPKGYQISQYDEPLCVSGSLKINSSRHSGEEPATTPESLSSSHQGDSGRASLARMTKEIRIRRVHLEEDTGKLQHAEVNGEQVSLVDFNRSGVPLVEIVTEPDFRTIDEVDQYLKKLQKIIRYLGISGADMEKGSMRIEPSISLSVILGSDSDSRISNKEPKSDSGHLPAETSAQAGARMTPDGLLLPEYRVELKNINSFRFARKALEYEIQRQTKLLEARETITQQTRGWNEAKNATVPQREKEEANDYRYFPEPDIPPMHFTKESIRRLADQIPELPDAKSARFQKDYGLSEYSAEILAEDKTTAEYFEASSIVLRTTNSELITIIDLANWIVNKKVDINNTVPAELISKILQSKQVSQVDEGELEKIVEQVILENPKAVDDYKQGKTQAIGYLMGIVLKQMRDVDKNTLLKMLKNKLK